MPTIRYLGHAGFVVEHAGVRLLIDPWFFPAFLGSWFPFPDNRALLPSVVDGHFDHLFVSHARGDHFDERVLQDLDPSVTVLVPGNRSGALTRQFNELGFVDQVVLDHGQAIDLAPGFTATVLLDPGPREGAGIVLDLDGFTFADLNTCAIAMGELPTGVDLLAARFSGAMWYPNAYAYPHDVMHKKVASVRAEHLDTLVRTLEATGAKTYLPSAGPACFLDPVLDRHNDRDGTVFPLWEQVAREVQTACPALAVVPVRPGDALTVGSGAGVEVLPGPGAPAAADDLDLVAYRRRRREEWVPFTGEPDRAVTDAELADHFIALQRRNPGLVEGFTKSVRLESGPDVWHVRLGPDVGPADIVTAMVDGVPTDYTLVVPPRVLRAIVDRTTGWEEALLSMRVDLARDPDVFDLTFMSLLRYGHRLTDPPPTS